MTCSARLSCRSPSRLRRCRSVRPEDTGTGAVPDSIAKACSLRIRPAWDQDSRICAALRGNRGRARRQPARGPCHRRYSLICASSSAATSARAVIRWPRRVDRLVGHLGQPAGACGAGQLCAGHGAALRRQVPELFTQLGGGGDEDRGQYGAGGLAGLNRVVPVNHQQPQRFAVTVGPHLRGCGAGQQLPRRADRVDRVALPRPPLADMPGAADLADLLARAGQVAGKAQPVMTGALDRPRQLLAGRLRRPRPADRA